MREPPSSVQATADAIRTRIAIGEIKAGDSLPSMRKLAGILRTSFLTVRKAVALLAREGIVEVQPRKVARVIGLNLKVKKRTCMVAHLFGDPELPDSYKGLLDQIQLRLKKKRWKLFGRSFSGMDQRERRAMVEELQPAVIVAIGISQSPLIFELEASGRPVISLDVDHGHAGISSVSPNHYGEGIRITRELINQGAKKIICIRHSSMQFMDGRRMQNLPHWQRHLGYRFAMRDAGLEPLILNVRKEEIHNPEYFRDCDALFFTNFGDIHPLRAVQKIDDTLPLGTFSDQAVDWSGPVWTSVPDLEYFADAASAAIFAGHQARPFSTVPCEIRKIQ